MFYHASDTKDRDTLIVCGPHFWVSHLIFRCVTANEKFVRPSPFYWGEGLGMMLHAHCTVIREMLHHPGTSLSK